MSASRPGRPSAGQIREEAARWLARFDRGLTAPETRSLETWRSADPRHASEYDRLAAAWDRWDGAADQAALAARAAQLEQATRRPPRRRVFFNWAAWTAAATVAAAATLGLRHLAGPPERAAAPLAVPGASYQVIAGAARIQKLPDGSLVELRDQSQIEVTFTARERRVSLVRGEANFYVSKDPGRPFLVSAGGVVVQAVGTAFDVRLNETAIQVLVTEGKVRVDDAERRISVLRQSEVLRAGEQAKIRSADNRLLGDPADVFPLTRDEIDRSLSWVSPSARFQWNPAQ